MRTYAQLHLRSHARTHTPLTRPRHAHSNTSRVIWRCPKYYLVIYVTPPRSPSPEECLRSTALRTTPLDLLCVCKFTFKFILSRDLPNLSGFSPVFRIGRSLYPYFLIQLFSETCSVCFVLFHQRYCLGSYNHAGNHEAFLHHCYSSSNYCSFLFGNYLSKILPIVITVWQTSVASLYFLDLVHLPSSFIFRQLVLSATSPVCYFVSWIYLAAALSCWLQSLPKQEPPPHPSIHVLSPSSPLSSWLAFVFNWYYLTPLSPLHTSITPPNCYFLSGSIAVCTNFPRYSVMPIVLLPC